MIQIDLEKRDFRKCIVDDLFVFSNDLQVFLMFLSFQKIVVCYYIDLYPLHSLILNIEKMIRNFPEQELTEKSTQ